MAIAAIGNFIHSHPRFSAAATVGIALRIAYHYHPIMTIVTCALAGVHLYNHYFSKTSHSLQAQDLTPKIQETLSILQKPSLHLSQERLGKLCTPLGIPPQDFQNLWSFFPGAQNQEVRKDQFLQMLHSRPSLYATALRIFSHQHTAQANVPSAHTGQVDPILQEEIPQEHLIYLNRTAFDDRSLFLCLINSPRCLNPMTNLPVTNEELVPLCKKFCLTVREFRGFWDTAENSAIAFILRESSRLYPHLSSHDAQIRYLLEHDEDLRNYKKNVRQETALKLVGYKDPFLAVELRKLQE